MESRRPGCLIFHFYYFVIFSFSVKLQFFFWSGFFFLFLNNSKVLNFLYVELYIFLDTVMCNLIIFLILMGKWTLKLLTVGRDKFCWIGVCSAWWRRVCWESGCSSWTSSSRSLWCLTQRCCCVSGGGLHCLVNGFHDQSPIPRGVISGRFLLYLVFWCTILSLILIYRSKYYDDCYVPVDVLK